MNRLNALKMISVIPKQTVKWAFDFQSWQPTESQWLLASSCVQEEEKLRVGKYVFKRDAKASLIGRLLIRKFVCIHSNLKYNEIFLKRDDRGKPFIEHEEFGRKLTFNVSHHGRWVILVGNTNGLNIGTDIMATRYKGGKNLNDFFRLMYRHFSDSEWNTIKNTSTDEEVKMFLFNRFWALKESYVKAIGIGIVVDLRKIEFRLNTKHLNSDSFVENTELYVDGVKQQEWSFQEILLDSDHIVAIAVNSKEFKDENLFHHLDFKELVNECVPLMPEDKHYMEEFFEKDEEPY